MAVPSEVLTTARLTLRRLDLEDSPFVLAVLNDPEFVRHIGDRGVRTLADARRYLLEGPLASYARLGFGLWLVVRTVDRVPLGLCGLLRRPGLDAADLGFAYLPQYRGVGHAHEAAAAVLAHGHAALGLRRIVAIVAPDNARSIRVLRKLGMEYERMVSLAPGQPELQLYASSCPPGP